MLHLAEFLMVDQHAQIIRELSTARIGIVARRCAKHTQVLPAGIGSVT
jgi:hypothetical protein